MLKWIKNHSKWATYFVLGTALIAVYKTFDSLGALWRGIGYVFSALSPFILAFVIAYMLNIPIRKLNELLTSKGKHPFIKKHSNIISIAFVYIVFIAFAVLIISSIIPAIVNDLLDIYNNIPKYAGEIVTFLNNFETVEKLGLTSDILAEQLNGVVEGLMSLDLIGYTKTLASGIASVASSLMNVFIGLIASIYMLIDKDRIINSIKRVANIFNHDGKATEFISHWSRVNEIFTQYIYSRLICCVVMAVACSFVLLIMGEKYALLLGIFIGFMDIIPYFGSIISWVVGLVVMTISGGWGHALICSLIILVMQQLDGNVLAPKVTSSRLEIRPLAIIVAVSVGGALFGFAGMLISVPVVAIVRAIVTELLEAKVERDAMAGKVNKE